MYEPRPLTDKLLTRQQNEENKRIAKAINQPLFEYVQLKKLNVAPSKPRDGCIYYADGTNWDPGHGDGYYYYNSSEAYYEPLFSLGVNEVTSTTTVANTTTETQIFTHTIPANRLYLNEIMKLYVDGYYGTNTGSDTWTIRIKLNGTTIETLTRASVSNVTSVGWHLDYQTTVRTAGASGIMVDGAILTDYNAILTNVDVGNINIDTTVSNTISITIQWGAANANNTFSISQGYINYLHP